MYKQPENNVNFPALERNTLAFWERESVFEKSLRLSEREMVFYDGPPFPTGAPHFGTIFVSILKDTLARYFTMAGYSVPRRWGWDCHGLPIENAVERQLGIGDKGEIEKKLGVAAFNDACRRLVSDCNDAWKSYIRKVGRWVDYEHAYRTLDRPYMESVLWIFKQCYQKGLIYKDFRVAPYCCRCETSLSISDTRESDSTRPRQDPSITILFRARADIAEKPTYFVAWTTTPWTLPSNLGLAVAPETDYVACDFDGKALVIAEARLPVYARELGEKPQILARFKGADLIGKTYEPLFPYFSELADQSYFRILAADFVTLDEGTGLVHMAPAFGEEDYWLFKRNGLGVKNPVDAAGCFTAEVPDYQGRNVHECNKDIIRRLKEQGSLLRHTVEEHNYPHCWRCRAPLIYRAMDAWYFAVEKIKPDLLVRNEDINWVPEHVKHGRFGNWLEGARDWNISRSRFWGTPIPVWECGRPGCGRREVLGSLEEIEKAAGHALDDLHKEHLDPIVLSCPACGSQMRRVPEVLDCWFESGAMPFGQCHYPFENKEWFESHFPADFIVEYPGQIRGWFYYLHVLAVAILQRASFKNCLVHGTLLAEDGSKISKSRKNFTDPMELIDHYGADALRLYLLSSPAVVMEDLNFKDSGVRDQVKDVLLPIWNAYSFFATYANLDGFRGEADAVPEPLHLLDRWILAKLHLVQKRVSQAYSTFYLNQVLGPVLEFLDDLTNWYIRQSRERFWAEGMSEDKRSAYATLFYALTQLLKLLAPSAPFLTDTLFQRLTALESVHLSTFPEIPDSFSNEPLIEQVRLVRVIASLALALRQKAGIRARQPLRRVDCALPAHAPREALEKHIEVLRNELNVKEIRFLSDPSAIAELRITLNFKTLGPKLGPEIQQVNAAVKAGRAREESGQMVVFDKDREWRLDLADVTMLYQGREGAEVLSSQGVVVALDKTITDDLREEGIANDLNRVIQDLRREAGYQVSDRIWLSLEGELAEPWPGKLADMALAELHALAPEQADAYREAGIEGRSFHVRIKRRQSSPP